MFNRNGFFLGLTILVILFSQIVAAEISKKTDQALESSKRTSEVKRVEKTLSISVNGKQLSYKLVFDCMPVKSDELSVYSGRMCYNAYFLEGKNSKETKNRPVTFFLNGGPGAASVFLNFGLAGPKIISPQINENNLILPGGTRLEDNPYTWLDSTDMVFIDPIGTGFSYVIPSKDNKQDKQKDEKVTYKKFWGLEKDLISLHHFIRLWITDNNRWISPKIIIGESYGGLRTAVLTDYLFEKGISLAGVVLVSPALNMWMLENVSVNTLVPLLVNIPSFIQTALYYNKGSLDSLTYSGNNEEKIESYLLKEYLPQIARGNTLSQQEKIDFYDTLSKVIGLERDLVVKKQGFISKYVFSKNLLADENMLFSLYDGTVKFVDSKPRESDRSGDLTYSKTIIAAFNTVANDYYRNELGLNSLREFYTLNWEIIGHWKYPSKFSKFSDKIEVFSHLEMGIYPNPKMEVLIVHGRHDMITPYYSSQFLINHSDIPNVKKKIRMRLYDGGHMFYLKQKSLKEFDEDIKKFYQRISLTSTTGK